MLIYGYKNGGFIVKDYKDFDNDIDYRGGAMDFPYERITERDREYAKNDFDKTSYSSLYVRLQYLENKIEDGYFFFYEFKAGDIAYFADIFRFIPRIEKKEITAVGFITNKLAYECKDGSAFMQRDYGNLFFKTEEEAQKRIEKFKREKNGKTRITNNYQKS